MGWASAQGRHGQGHVFRRTIDNILLPDWSWRLTIATGKFGDIFEMAENERVAASLKGQ